MTTQTPVPLSDRAAQPLFYNSENDDQSSHIHRQFIGGLGLMLPFLLVGIAGLRPIEGLEQWKPLSSISAYYYTGAVAAFVGTLIVLAVFLFIYRGYNNKYGLRDRVAAIIAGCAAVLVAFFPTESPSELLPAPTWWTECTGTTHYTAAVVLFCTFAYFSLFLFTKSKGIAGMVLSLDKRVRNGIYYFCGAAIVACISWAAIAKSNEEPIFLPEVGALIFFAISWLAKGRADWTAVTLGLRTLHYSRHPGQLVDKILKAASK